MNNNVNNEMNNSNGAPMNNVNNVPITNDKKKFSFGKCMGICVCIAVFFFFVCSFLQLMFSSKIVYVIKIVVPILIIIFGLIISTLLSAHFNK